MSGSTQVHERDRPSNVHVAGIDLDTLALQTFVERPRLLRRFEESDAPVVVLDAPTGYGKSVALAQWAEADPRPFASVTLTDEHNDPVVFLSALIEALSPIEPIPAEVSSALVGAELNLEGVVLSRFEGALIAREVPMVLVLDELEHIESPSTLRSIRSVIDNIAAGSQVALSARSLPALSLGRLRANRRLTEVRRTDLVMTPRECGALLRGLGLELTAGDLDILVRRTEGWPAALYLAGLALSDQANTSIAISRFAGDDRIVVDYIRDEFLAPASRRRVDFLKRISILDRFTGELCDALLERTGSATRLRDLSTQNTLIVPLDRRDEWFRFHSLFSEMLRSELHRTEPDLEPALHRRASEWWEGHGDSTQAIQHAIAAEAFDRVGELMWAAVPEYMARGRYATVKRWLERLGPDRVAADPCLSLTAAHGYLSRGQGGLAEHWAGVARGTLVGMPDSAKRRSLLAGLALLDATLARGGVAEMRQLSTSAARVLADDSVWVSMCCLTDGVAALIVDETAQARHRLSEGARRAAVFGAPLVQTICLAQVALVAADEDDWHVARMLASQARAQVDRSGLSEYPTISIVLATSAFARAHDGHAEKALEDLRAGIRLLGALDAFGAWYEIQTRIVLARAAVKLDDVPVAHELLDEARRRLSSVPDAVLLKSWLEQTERALSAVSATAIGDLTPAELRILQFLPTHLSFPQIAAKVYVSPNTVKTQAQAVYRKLDVSSRREAVERALQAGLLSDEPARVTQE